MKPLIMFLLVVLVCLLVGLMFASGLVSVLAPVFDQFLNGDGIGYGVVIHSLNS